MSSNLYIYIYLYTYIYIIENLATIFVWVGDIKLLETNSCQRICLFPGMHALIDPFQIVIFEELDDFGGSVYRDYNLIFLV